MKLNSNEFINISPRPVLFMIFYFSLIDFLRKEDPFLAKFLFSYQNKVRIHQFPNCHLAGQQNYGLMRLHPKPSLKIGSVSKCFCFDIDYGLNHISFRTKTFLFYNIENWNFQHLFEKKIHETSQNFKSIRQPIGKMEITIVWMSWKSRNFVTFHKILFQIDA